MYTRNEASRMKQEFWTVFGRYMQPVQASGYEKVNWINYKTGIRDIYFRMDANREQAFIRIEIKGDETNRRVNFTRFTEMKTIFENVTGTGWLWQANFTGDDNNPVAIIEKKLTGVNVFDKNDWPALITFFKEGIISLDRFWYPVKDLFD